MVIGLRQNPPPIPTATLKPAGLIGQILCNAESDTSCCFDYLRSAAMTREIAPSVPKAWCLLGAGPGLARAWLGLSNAGAFGVATLWIGNPWEW